MRKDKPLKDGGNDEGRVIQGPDSVDTATMARLDPVLSPLNLRQRAFVLAFIRLGVGTHAAREAGFSAKSAKNRASTLLKVPAIRAAIDECRKIITEKAGYDIHAAMAELDDSIRFAKTTKNATALVRAIELRCRMAGLLEDRDSGAKIGGLQIFFHDEVNPSPRQSATVHALPAPSPDSAIDAGPPGDAGPPSAIPPIDEPPPPGAFFFPKLFIQEKGHVYDNETD